MNNYRLEKKFVYYQGDVSFKYFILSSMLKETFPKRIVNSIYLDTPGLNDIWDNINGFGIRKKIRIRWYNQINNSEVFIEEKRKINNICDKKVHSLGIFKDYSDLTKYISGEKYLEKKIILDKKLNLKKTIFIQYNREYYELPNNKLRLTIDNNLKVFNIYPSNFISFDKTIIELKYKIKDTKFINNFIYKHELKNRNQKFSKYVNSFIESNNSAYI